MDDCYLISAEEKRQPSITQRDSRGVPHHSTDQDGIRCTRRSIDDRNGRSTSKRPNTVHSMLSFPTIFVARCSSNSYNVMSREFRFLGIHQLS